MGNVRRKNTDMNSPAKVLRYGISGALIGLWLVYGFNLLRGMLSPMILEISKSAFSGQPANPEYLLLVINLLHAFLSAVVVGLIAVFIVVNLLKTAELKYCILPCAVVIALSYGEILTETSTSLFRVYSGYPAQLINPVILVAVFTGLFWGAIKLTAPNKVPQPTPKSGAAGL